MTKAQRSRGTVKWFNDQKGYGFITPADGTKDLFVHHSSILGHGFKSLEEGEEIEYTRGEGLKGPAAMDVDRITKGRDDSPPAAPEDHSNAGSAKNRRRKD